MFRLQACSLLGALLVICTVTHAYSHGHYSPLGDLLHWYSHAARAHPSILRYLELREQGYDHAIVPLATISNFTANEDTIQARRTALLIFGEHARELITSEVGLWLSRVLVGDTAELFSWAEWPAAFSALNIPPASIPATVQGWVSRILDRLVIKLLPIENMDGRQSWEAGNLCLRKTSKGVDLNRNYPFAFANEPPHSEMYGGPHPFSEAQSRIIARLALEGDRVPVAYINVHSGEWAVYSPWDSKAAVGPGLPSDMSDLLLKSGDICRCQAGPAGAVSNYLAYGTGMDFMYTQLGVPYALTYEVYGESNGFGQGAAGRLAEGAKNQPLDTFAYTADAGIARSAPRIEDLLPPPLAGRGRHHHRSSRKARRVVRETDVALVAGATGAVAEEGGAGLSGTAAGGVATGDGVGRRRRAGLRRMFARREATGAALKEQQLAQGGGGAVGAGGEGGGYGAGSGGGYSAVSSAEVFGRQLQGMNDEYEDSDVEVAQLGGRALEEWGWELEDVHPLSDGGGVAEEVGSVGALAEGVEAAGLLLLGGRSMRHLAAAGMVAGGVGTAASGGGGHVVDTDSTRGEMLAAASSSAAELAGEERRGRRGLLQQGPDLSEFGGPDGPVIAMVRTKPQVQQSCFDMFNPPPGAAYRDAISRWVVILLMTLDHVADPANPRPSPHTLPGTVLAGTGDLAIVAPGRRRLLGMDAEETEVVREDMQSGEGLRSGIETEGLVGGAASQALASGDGQQKKQGTGAQTASANVGGERSRYGSEGFTERVNQKVYEVDPEMRQHSMTVFVGLCVLGVVFVPWWMYATRFPAPSNKAALPMCRRQGRSKGALHTSI